MLKKKKTQQLQVTASCLAVLTYPLYSIKLKYTTHVILEILGPNFYTNNNKIYKNLQQLQDVLFYFYVHVTVHIFNMPFIMVKHFFSTANSPFNVWKKKSKLRASSYTVRRLQTFRCWVVRSLDWQIQIPQKHLMNFFLFIWINDDNDA